MKSNYDAWPELPYEKFKSTQHLLHMLCQILGKLKLSTPFEPHWANVGLWLTADGLTTGPIPFGQGIFEIRMDFIRHKIFFVSSWNDFASCNLKSSSVSDLNKMIFECLQLLSVNLTINPMPQEVQNPIAFHEDKLIREYDAELVNAWWRILVSSYRVMLRYHAKFKGPTPQIALMWGTFDLRDARYINKMIPTTGNNAGFIRRNAMDMAQVEVGWWSGNEAYPRPAYFSFLYPAPLEVEKSEIDPALAHWDASLGEFILNYDDLRQSSDPEKTLLLFFESSYEAQTQKAGWDASLIGSGEPV